MDKLKSVLSGKDEDEEQGIVTQVRNGLSSSLTLKAKDLRSHDVISLQSLVTHPPLTTSTPTGSISLCQRVLNSHHTIVHFLDPAFHDFVRCFCDLRLSVAETYILWTITLHVIQLLILLTWPVKLCNVPTYDNMAKIHFLHYIAKAWCSQSCMTSASNKV